MYVLYTDNWRTKFNQYAFWFSENKRNWMLINVKYNIHI